MKRSLLFAALTVCASAGVASGDTIWGIDNAADTLGTFDSAAPGTFNPIGTTGIVSGFVNCMEFDGAGNMWASDGASLYSVNTTTGAGTFVGSHGLAGQSMGDFSWDPATSTMYAIATSCSISTSFYTVNLATGAATFVCASDVPTPCDVGLTFEGSGLLYGHDLVNDIIYTFDLNSCTSATVVNIPYNSNFGQGLCSNTGTGTNYHVAFNNDAFQGELYDFDSGGAYNFLGALGPLQIAGADVEEGSADCLTLQVNTLTAGQNGIWKVSGATPGEQVAVVWGTSPGTTVINGFAGYCATFGIDKVNKNRVVCRKNADGAGVVSCNKLIPLGAQGLRVLSQAAERNTCQNECVSNLDDQVVQ